MKGDRRGGRVGLVARLAWRDARRVGGHLRFQGVMFLVAVGAMLVAATIFAFGAAPLETALLGVLILLVLVLSAGLIVGRFLGPEDEPLEGEAREMEARVRKLDHSMSPYTPRNFVHGVNMLGWLVVFVLVCFLIVAIGALFGGPWPDFGA